MRKVMVLQHVGHEPLGTLNPLLKAAGLRIRYVNFGRHPDSDPSLDSYSGLVILGGPMGVYETDRHPHLKTELRLIEDALKREIPVLGICLGAQLMAAALGAKVTLAPQPEAGWHEVHLTAMGSADPLFSSYRSAEKIFQMHQDTFEIPRSSEHLARSLMCEGQAFRYGKKAYGLQFHLEVDQPMIRRWLQRPENQRMIEDVTGVQDATQVHIQRSLELSHNTFKRFIDLFELPPRPELLGSSHGGKGR